MDVHDSTEAAAQWQGGSREHGGGWIEDLRGSLLKQRVEVRRDEAEGLRCPVEPQHGVPKTPYRAPKTPPASRVSACPAFLLCGGSVANTHPALCAQTVGVSRALSLRGDSLIAVLPHCMAAGRCELVDPRGPAPACAAQGRPRCGSTVNVPLKRSRCRSPARQPGPVLGGHVNERARCRACASAPA